MHTFFHGWRRKTGVVSLVMACVFTVGWMRSRVALDSVAFAVGGRQYQICSWRGRIHWMGAAPHKQMGALNQWHSEAVTPSVPDDSDSIRAVFMSAEIMEHFQAWQWRYWSLTIPLTLLSAYLILWKPRKRV